jgi:ATP-binding cassette subfamily B protein
MTSWHDEDDTSPSRLDLSLWRRMLVHARPHSSSLAGLAIAGLIVAVCDVFFPRVTGAVIDDSIANGGGRLWLYGGLYLSLVVILAVTVWLFIVLAGVAATGVAHDLRRAAFSRLQSLSFSFYDRRPVGWLIARLTTDCERIASVLPWTLLDLVWGSFLLSGVTVMMLWMNWRLALVVLIIVPPLSVATVIYQKKLIRTQRLVRKANSRITASFNEGITGVRTSKAFGREENNLADFEALTDEMLQHSLRSALQAAVFLPIVMTLGATGVGLALWRGGLFVGAAIGVGELVTFMQYAALFHIPIQEMAQRFTGLQAAQASAERLQGLLDTEPEIADSADVCSAVAQQRIAPREGFAPDGQPNTIHQVTFENVTFAYGKGKPVLADFRLTVRAGECIAIVGETGSGKSTVAKLLCRFYEPVKGRVTINGVDYRKRSLHWLQSNLGIVLQEPHLFSGTIRANIRYGRLAATDHEIEAVADQVGAAAFIEGLDRGYDTEVGEGGNQLSTGQKQLIALARAMIANPQILVLDEATSSVDTETERKIQKGIETVLRGRISIVIAHRLSTIRSASKIVVLDRGRIVEEGTHIELLGCKGPYSRLYAQQFRSEAASAAVEYASDPDDSGMADAQSV